VLRIADPVRVSGGIPPFTRTGFCQKKKRGVAAKCAESLGMGEPNVLCQGQPRRFDAEEASKRRGCPWHSTFGSCRLGPLTRPRFA